MLPPRSSWAYLSDSEVESLAQQELRGLVAPELMSKLNRRELVSLLSAQLTLDPEGCCAGMPREPESAEPPSRMSHERKTQRCVEFRLDSPAEPLKTSIESTPDNGHRYSRPVSATTRRSSTESTPQPNPHSRLDDHWAIADVHAASAIGEAPGLEAGAGMDELLSDSCFAMGGSTRLAGIAETEVPAPMFWRSQGGIAADFAGIGMGSVHQQMLQQQQPHQADAAAAAMSSSAVSGREARDSTPPWTESSWHPSAAQYLPGGVAQSMEKRPRSQPSWLERRFQGLESIDLGDASPNGKEEDCSDLHGQPSRAPFVLFAPEDFVDDEGNPEKHPGSESAEYQAHGDQSCSNAGSSACDVAQSTASSAGGVASSGGGGDHGAGPGPDANSAEWASSYKRWSGLRTSDNVEPIALAARVACAVHSRP